MQETLAPVVGMGAANLGRPAGMLTPCNAGAPGIPHAPSPQGIPGSAQGHALLPQRQSGTAGRAARVLEQGPGPRAANSAHQDQARGFCTLPPGLPPSCTANL